MLAEIQQLYRCLTYIMRLPQSRKARQDILETQVTQRLIFLAVLENQLVFTK